MPLTAIDTYGRPLIRQMLREEPSAAIVGDLRFLLTRTGASFTVEDVAGEVGVMLPAEPAPLPRARRAHTARKDRHRWA